MQRWIVLLLVTSIAGAFETRLSPDDQIRHALDRLTFGARPGDFDAVKRMGLDKWIETQLNPGAENDALASKLDAFPTLKLTPREAVEQYPRVKGGKKQGPQVLARELTEAKLYRAIYSERQLEEQLVDFWFNHFNVNIAKGGDRYLTTAYERDAIRPRVWGKFRDLLGATAAHPAMLFYLDNWRNSVPGGRARDINENYARELLELHTLGVDNGYSQQDIIEVARCFTGWTILKPLQGGEFMFNPRMHDNTEKTVLGVKIPAGGGQRDGERVLDILVKRSEAARFLSLKLAQRFVADDPPAALVERMAKRFRDTDGDLRAVVTTMIQSEEFFSQSAFRAKVKTPLEFVVSALRASGADVVNAQPLGQKLADMGQPLYRMVEPTGYSSQAVDWVNSSGLLARINFAADLAANRVPGVRGATSTSNLGSPEFQRR